MLAVLFLFTLSLSSAHLQCGHTPETEEEITFMPHHSGRTLAENDLRDTTARKPIRLYFHYLDMSMTSALKDEFQNQLMKTVQNFYTNRLLVYPFKENLKLTGKSMCSSVSIPTEHQTVGVPADLIIYVYGNSYSSESWVARAGACVLDSEPYNNVLAGKIEINTSQYTSTLAFEDKMQTVIHEIFHILGFSNSLYQYFRKPDGSSYSSSDLTLSTTVRGKTVTILKTPTVVAKAQAAFGCTSMPGLELEDGGGSGTAGSHWEKRMMFNDFMIGDIGPSDIIYSDITFAVLKDSGWYDINWDYTDTIYYGKGKGCEFYQNKCVVNSVPQFPEFCADDMSKNKCNYTRLYKGFCNKITNTSSLPSYMQYFGSPNLGGSDKYLDYCPVVAQYSNGSCRGNGGSQTELESGAGEEIGNSSRCIEHNLLQASYTYSSRFQSIRAGCYPIRCTGTSYYVTVGGNEVQCTPGQQVSINGYNGKLTCPQMNEVCGDAPCPYACKGVGKCEKGKCVCNTGYSGDDCSIGGSSSGTPTGSGTSTGTSSSNCPALCQICSSNSNCITCKSNASKNTSGGCSCNAGYINMNETCILASSAGSGGSSGSGNTGYSGVCPSLCQTCSSSSNCTVCKPNSTRNSSGVCSCNSGYINMNGSCILASSAGTSSSTNCPTLCKTCSSPSICTICKPNSSKNSRGGCSCNAGYINITNSCTLASQAGTASSISSESDCPPLCDSCNSSNCEVCKLNASPDPEGNCACNSGYTIYNDNCIPICDISCKTCSQNNPSYCTSCKNNSHLSHGSCICNPGYTYNSQGLCSSFSSCPSGCASCSSSYVCSSCKSGYHLWSSSSSCQSFCPTSYSLDNYNTCIPINNAETLNLKLFNYFWTSSSNQISMSYQDSATSSPINPQGVYFSGQTYTSLTSNILFNSDFLIEMLIRPDPNESDFTLFSKYSNSQILTIGINESNILYISLRMYNLSTQSTEYQTVSSTSISPGQWHKIAVSVSFTEDSTSISFYDKFSLLSFSTIPNAYFLDDESSNSHITIGARYNSGLYDSFYKGFVAALYSKNTSEYKISNRMLGAFEENLPNCQFGEFFDGECKKCKEECKNGCNDGNSCIGGCEELEERIGSKCECVKNATREKETCKCREGYSQYLQSCRKNSLRTLLEKLLEKLI